MHQKSSSVTLLDRNRALIEPLDTNLGEVSWS